MKKLTILLAALFFLLTLSGCKEEDVLHLGLNAQLLEVDAKNSLIYVQDVDPETNLFGERCTLDCTVAEEEFRLCYCDYQTHDIYHIELDDLQPGDMLILGIWRSELERERAPGEAIPIKQLQLGTQRLSEGA